MHPCRYNISAFLERQSHARTLLEVIEGQQMVSGGDVNDIDCREWRVDEICGNVARLKH
ncbi:MAG TPA: hypothetical protein VGJ48_00650 [Pyrinomonadaceae bacterium]